MIPLTSPTKTKTQVPPLSYSSDLEV